MREIKFRAWDKERREWVSRFCAIDSTGELISTSPFQPLHQLSYEDFEVTQYTGLKDKNGKEIYEGDIVCWTPNWGNITPFTGVVEWFLHGFKIMRLPLRDRWDTLSHDWKVIGNIYKNPELLGDKNE